jgi:predicted DNA-binding ribbon-helix-helix protein
MEVKTMSPTTNEKIVTIKMNDTFISRLDYLARKAKMSRHQLLKNLLDVGIDELNDFKKIGLFKLGVLARDVADFCNLKMSDPVTGDKSVPVTLDETFIAILDDLATQADLSRAQLMRNLVRVGVEGLETMDKIGIIKLMTIIRELPNHFRSVCNDGENAVIAIKNAASQNKKEVNTK